MRHLLSTLALAPLLLGQGLHTRRVTPRLPEPPGERSGTRPAAAGCTPVPLSLLLLGDSSMAGVGADHQDQALLGQLLQVLPGQFQVRYLLQASTGHRTRDTLAALPGIQGSFDLVVTALGVNDVTANTSLQRFRRQQMQLLSSLQQHQQPWLLVVSGLPPMHLFPALPQPLRWHLGARARQLDQVLAEVSRESGASHLPFLAPPDPGDVASDGFHPGPPAYARWAQAVLALAAPRLIAPQLVKQSDAEGVEPDPGPTAT